jgi:hypothetical protein
MGFQNKKASVQEMFLGRRQDIFLQLFWGSVSFAVLAGIASDWSWVQVLIASQISTFGLLHFARLCGRI